MIMPIRRRNGDLFEVLVDDEDFELVSAKNWHIIEPSPGKFYAARRLREGAEYMHRTLMGLGVGQRQFDPRLVDHRNGNSLDNRRWNLRITDYVTNGQNRRGASRTSKSGIRGVFFDTARGQWMAYHMFNGQVWQRRYPTQIEAAVAVEARRRLVLGG